MTSRRIWWTGVGAVGLCGVIGGAWLLSLPLPPTEVVPPPIGKQEADALLAALKPPKRPRPLMAIVGINDATETTDYLMPYGILRRSGVADVTLLATGHGPVKLYPALTVEPQGTTAEFDARHPDGADYVIVPAMSRDDDPAVLDWIKRQSAKGAMIVGVCAGAKVVAAAGLLDGKRATTHWYYVEELLDAHPGVQYVADRRLVVDGGVTTTTGITASMPIALSLIEAIAGRDRAETVARDVGLSEWDARHASDRFRFTRPFALTAIGNTLAIWNRERLGLELESDVDEVTLALVADAWSRTYRSRAVTWSRSPGAKETRHGVRVLPEKVAPAAPGQPLPSIAGWKPVDALDETLDQIASRYGTQTANFVAMQLEYPRDRPRIRTRAANRTAIAASSPTEKYW